MTFFNLQSTGNSLAFGNLSDTFGYVSGYASHTRAVFSCNYNDPAALNTLEFITIATTGNRSDFGDMTVARAGGGTGNSTRGIFMGGSTNPSGAATNIIDFIMIASTGDAKDFGDLLFAGRYGATIGDSHGGIE